jgi:hypothetical protein
MSDNSDHQWDDDIAALELTDIEKNGLQTYRNYTKSFNQRREEEFARSVDEAELEIDELTQVISLVHKEDIRFVPVIACAFADDELKRMFNTFLREGIPGGKKAMLGRFGPISSLYSRIQFAYAFDMMNHDILEPLDKLREHRNKLSHTWNASLLLDFFKDPLPQMDGLEDALQKLRASIAVDAQNFPESAFRIRTIWILTRTFYEARFYPLAKLAGVMPNSALYGVNHPKCLGKICTPALNYTRMIAPD